MVRVMFFVLIGLIALISTMPLCGCNATAGGDDGRDVLACEAAVVTLLDAPQPAPEPEPEPDGPDLGAAGQFGGPIDMLRDARSLIDKGNALADRGKALLDAAQREGKITVDVRLPGAPQAAADAGPSRPEPQQQMPAVGDEPAYECSGGVCRPRLLWRFRR